MLPLALGSGLALGSLALAGGLAPGSLFGPNGTAEARTFAAAMFALQLDGGDAGLLRSAAGGEATGVVVTEQIGSGLIGKKHLAGVEYQDIVVEAGADAGRPVWDWVKKTLDNDYTRKNGVITMYNAKGQEAGQLSFRQALISEIGFPAADAASKDPAYLTLKLAPEFTRITRDGGGGKADSGSPSAKSKGWLSSDFRLKIDGLDEATAKVSKVDALNIKQTVVRDNIGDARDYEQEPGSVEIPNLVITLPEAHADAFYRWHEDFVINGNNGDEKEKSGSLVYLSRNRQKELLTLNFRNLGIFKITSDQSDAQSDKVRQVTVEMYVEGLSLELGDIIDGGGEEDGEDSAPQ